MGGGLGVGKLPCLAHSVYVCAALHARGLWEFNLKKKYSMSLFSILNREAISIHFALNRVRIEGF